MFSLLKDTGNTCSRSYSSCQSYCDERTDTPTTGFPSHAHTRSVLWSLFCVLEFLSCRKSQSDLSFSQSVFYWLSTPLPLSHTTGRDLYSWRKISLFFQNHRHTKSFPDVLKIEPGFLLLLLHGALHSCDRPWKAIGIKIKKVYPSLPQRRHTRRFNVVWWLYKAKNIVLVLCFILHTIP